MRVITRATLDMNTMEWTSIESYEYEGPVALCGGGPSDSQKRAAQRQEEQTTQDMATQRRMLADWEAERAKVDPYWTGILKNGVPGLRQLTDLQSGTYARSLVSPRAMLLRSMGPSNGLPNGFRDQTLADFEASAARGFDDTLAQSLLMNINAKNQAAAGLTNQMQLASPLQWSGAVTAGNNAVLQAPLQSPDRFGPIMSAVGGMLSNPGLKF